MIDLDNIVLAFEAGFRAGEKGDKNLLLATSDFLRIVRNTPTTKFTEDEMEMARR